MGAYVLRCPSDVPTASSAPLVVFRPVHRNGSTVAARGMSEAAINDAVQRACVRALGTDGRAYSAHSLRAGFATYASERGASDRAIAHQTRHRSLASLDQYIRMESAWADNAATALDLRAHGPNDSGPWAATPAEPLRRGCTGRRRSPGPHKPCRHAGG